MSVAPPVPATSSDHADPATTVASDTKEKMTEQSTQKSSLVDIPSRTSSTQQISQQSKTVSPPPDTSTGKSPTPRRGSKRSILTRSRNNSKSSRRSGKAVKPTEEKKEPVPPLPQNDGTRSEKKPRSGFLSFLNCCSPSEEGDNTKNDGPVPAKKTTIQPTPTRSGRPVDQTETTIPEKQSEAKANSEDKGGDEEKTALAEDMSREGSRPKIRRDDGSQEKVAPMPSTVSTEQSRATPNTPNEQVDKRDVNMIAPTTIPQQRDGPKDTADEAKDVDMTDAPAPEEGEVTYIPVDEPVQPAELQPQVPLPPPPPLSKRQEQVGTVVPAVPETSAEKTTWLLPAAQPPLKGRKCLILDLDETLVHSSFKILNQADFTIPVEIEGQYHNVYVIKRPGVDAFMKRVGELYEVVVFTASVSKYGDPLLDQLDIHHVVHHRLFRESCYNHQGNYVKVS